MEAQDNQVKLSPTWLAHLQPEFDKPYMVQLKTFLKGEISRGKTVYPRGAEYFEAMNKTPFDSVRVVILGQDPYHGPGQAHGLCFSVPPGVPAPPSLVNMFKEMRTDLGIEPPPHGCLEPWARQGVLLLNSVLTVEANLAGSHANHGWEAFTDRIIELLNTQRDNLVFVLWGAYAQKKGALIDRQRHLVISSPHPSPLSAHRGFFGTRPFSRVNQHLTEHGVAPIDWRLPPLH